ncbi:hypothetical protein [Candidatus Nitrosocosmicus franklandus]|uniref:Uncharacterized protein n=1 Tax=Candidatus Nitrosocosmicus franklandianus TaxID=1798806 RepID=A0A484I5L1_9ARCH|nr:hypothetical protein [Candidatus Nitrosocosmicus franklandus]VFJ12478.1 conserved protein of unknown function [Candidatus Nitrosocosmicus franklandus]
MEKGSELNMEGIEDNNENDSNVIKKFLLEISGKFKTSSTVEFSNYEEALDLFNRYSKEGKKTLILYEVHKSAIDGATVKKVPVLNTSKHEQRLRELEEEERIRAFYEKKNNPTPSVSAISSSTAPGSPSPNQKNKMTWANMKNKIIILVAVVVGFIAMIFIMDFLAGGGSGGAGHHVVLYDFLQDYGHTTNSGVYNNPEPKPTTTV